MNEDYFRRLEEIGATLNASPATLNFAMHILQIARAKRVTSGRNPRVLAATALYTARLKRLGPISERWTLKQVALPAGVCERAVGKTYHLFIDKLGLDLESTFEKSYNSIPKNLGSNLEPTE